MPTEPTNSPQSPNDAGLHDRLAEDIRELQSRLADLDARRRAQVEAERAARDGRERGCDPDVPGIPE